MQCTRRTETTSRRRPPTKVNPSRTDRAARRMYEGAGLGPKDVDVFNPYDGYAPIAQFFLEAFQWHGVKRGDAFAFYAGDIRVEGPHPFCSMLSVYMAVRVRPFPKLPPLEQNGRG